MSNSMHSPQIITSQTGIARILKDHRLRVPPHQREYRWKERHVERLFEDLFKAITSDEKEYFLGTIVTIPDALGVLEVIDGQQRLATITILLSEIRRYLYPLEPDLATKSISSFITEYDSHQRADVHKLRLNLGDNEFFARMLSSQSPSDPLPPGSPKSHRRIRNAFLVAEKYVRKIVAPANQKTHGDVLINWLDYIEHHAEVILLRVPTGANAYRMFETLNDRGLRSSQADLVKCYLFQNAGDRYPEAQEAWSQMIGALSSLQGEEDDDNEKDERSDITMNFLRIALILLDGFIRRNEIYETLQKLVKGTTTAISILSELRSLAGVFEATYSQDHEKWKKYPDEARYAIQTINDFDIKPFRPCLVAVAAKFDSKEASQAFQMFVSLGVRLLVASSTRSGPIEETLAAAARSIYKGDTKTALSLKQALAAVIPSDTQFQSAFETATVSVAWNARYYLRVMEQTHQSKTNPWWIPNEDKEKMTLEHVLPENPEGNWPAFTPDQVELYVKRLGNLCLLPKGANSDLRSAGEARKFEVYRDATYELTRQIGREKDWSAQKIVERQKGLAKLAVKAWPL
jgi:Protein of unknown function DUF262/Protein of unknown function (DUF1524)